MRQQVSALVHERCIRFHCFVRAAYKWKLLIRYFDQLLCFFQAGGWDVLGSFYCSYEEYEKWRKVFFCMMQTVEIQEGGEE